MKTKRFNKKLVLNKKTIAHLERGELNAARGKSGPHCGNPVYATEFCTVIGHTCPIRFCCV